MESSIFVLKNRRIPEKTSEREEEERVNHLRVSISSSSSNSKLAMSRCLFFTSIISLSLNGQNKLSFGMQFWHLWDWWISIIYPLSWNHCTVINFRYNSFFMWIITLRSLIQIGCENFVLKRVYNFNSIIFS